MNLAQRKIEARNILNNIEQGIAQTAPLVTKHLIEKFEQTGISPVCSKNGQIVSLKLLKSRVESQFIFDDIWTDLENGIKNYHYRLEDFWFLEYEQTTPKAGAYPAVSSLLVVAKNSGKSKEYNVGNGLTFPADLIQDVKNNFFK